MNKFLLILILVFASSCELPSIIQADQYIEPIPTEVSSNISDYEDVWERIIDTSSSENNMLDEKTLRYINGYLANPAQFNKLLEKGRYFIFFPILNPQSDSIHDIFRVCEKLNATGLF